MGQTLDKYTMPQKWKQDEPDAAKPLKYHPQFGFSEPRELKVPTATKEEMDSCNTPMDKRDACVYYYLRYKGCIHYEMPFFWRCKHMEHELHHCHLHDEWIHGAKEMERERRLNARERRIREGSG